MLNTEYKYSDRPFDFASNAGVLLWAWVYPTPFFIAKKIKKFEKNS